MTECTLPFNSAEYKKLDMVAKMLTFDSPTGVHYYVDETYLDFGQNWTWTTIIARRSNRDEWQALDPREWKEIMRATSSSELAEIVKRNLADKYCPDHE